MKIKTLTALLSICTSFPIISNGQPPMQSLDDKFACHTQQKDTLYLKKCDIGYLIAESWTIDKKTNIEKFPAIVFLSDAEFRKTYYRLNSYDANNSK